MKCIPIVCFCTLLLTIGCRKQSIPLAQAWSAPIKITETKDSMAGGVRLYKWHNTVIALQGQDDNSAKCFLINSNNVWSESPLTGVPRGFSWDTPAMDKDSDRVFFEQGYIENDQLIMNVLVGRMTLSGSIAVQDVTEKKWMVDTKALFGETQSIVRLTERPGTRDWPELGIGIINGSDFYIPCSVEGFTFNQAGAAIARGPYENGVFHSADVGTTWQLEKISDFFAALTSVCRSKAYYYYLAVKPGMNQLWFAKKPVAEGVWTAPETVTETLGGFYVVVPQDDTVHLCWLDSRHEKKQLDIGVFPPHLYTSFKNCEIGYCQRKDSDTGWSKDIILSKGLLYAFSPSMSVEGNNIVVAWAGIQTAGVWHSPSDPNDIYYITSKDGGKSWTDPLRVTDNVKEGITAGDPQVVLLNGIIHLTYIQGKLNLKQESPGLTKLNQPPWPIYYQQRPFPN